MGVGGGGCPLESSYCHAWRNDKMERRPWLSLFGKAGVLVVSCNSDPEGGLDASMSPAPSTRLMAVLKIAPQNWLMATFVADDKGTLCSHGLYFSPFTHGLILMFLLCRFHRPWKQGVSSVKKCWAENFSDAATSCSAVTLQRAWSLFVFSESLAFFQHPRLSHQRCEGAGVGDKMTVMFAAVCPGDYWTSPHGSWLVGEDFGGASLTLRMRVEGEKKQSCHSVSVVFLYYFMDSFDKAVWIRVVGGSCACDQLHLFLTDE